MELEGGLGYLGLRLLEAVSTFLGTSISHSLTSQWLVFLSLCYGDTKAYFTVCRKQEGFKILDAVENVVPPTVFVSKERYVLHEKIMKTFVLQTVRK